MTSIIEKRLSLHTQLAAQQQQNSALKSQINHLHTLATIGTATCMIAHEINNLLTPLGSYAALALKNPQDTALAEKVLQKTMNNCRHASKIMDSMLAVANGQAQQMKNSRLIVLVEEVFTSLCRDFSKDKITVNIQIPKNLKVRAVPVQIQQVLMNLILNARDAMLPAGGLLTIKASDTAEIVRIELADTGSGIEPLNLKSIFDPFFTTSADKKSPPKRSGSGLGLAFCKQIIEAHGGAISVHSEPARGTTFKITLPKAHAGNS